eukprot:COSAG02_NODE_6316_length_3655_cov_2.787120_3_plen_186_part_00
MEVALRHESYERTQHQQSQLGFPPSSDDTGHEDAVCPDPTHRLTGETRRLPIHSQRSPLPTKYNVHVLYGAGTALRTIRYIAHSCSEICPQIHPKLLRNLPADQLIYILYYRENCKEFPVRTGTVTRTRTVRETPGIPTSCIAGSEILDQVPRLTNAENGTQPEKSGFDLGIFRLHSLTHGYIGQ